MIGPYKLKKISTIEQTQNFIDGFAQAYSTKKLKNKHSLKVETLMQYNYVFGIFKKDILLAGFIVNLYPQRCFEDLSTDQQNRVVQDLGSSSRVSEVVAIWKGRSLSRFILWFYVTFATLVYGRKYIFGCAYKGHGMTKNYYLLSPKLVKSGQASDDLEVFYYTRIQFFLSFIFGAINAAVFQPVRNTAKFFNQFFGQRDTNIIE